MNNDNVTAVRNAYAVAERKDLEGLVTFSHCCGTLAAVHEADETSIVLWLPLPA